MRKPTPSKGMSRLLKKYAPPRLQGEGEWSTRDFADYWGISKTTAKLRLDAAVEAGDFRAEKRRSKNGKNLFVYFVIEAKK